MWQDHIIAEIHQIREKLSQAYGNDLHAIFVAAQRGELAKGLGAQESQAQQGVPADWSASAASPHRQAGG
jgi:hypothetical protein